MFYEAGYSRDCATEEKQNDDESARLYVSEDENMMNNSDLNAEETRDVIAELTYSQERLKELNVELQHSVELADDQNTALHTENTALRNQLKSLRQAMYDAEKLGEEVDDVRRLTAEQDSAIGCQKNKIRQLERENKALKELHENITSELSCVLPERARDKSKIADLSNTLKALQQQMEELRLNLNEKDSVLHEKILIIEHLEKSLEEYLSNIQELRVRNMELKAELEETMVIGGKNASELMESLDPAGQQSLGDELRLVSHSWGDSSQEEEEEEEEQIEEKIRVQDEKPPMGDAVEETSSPLVEARAKSWWQQRAKGLVKGAQAAGTLTLGYLFPLGLVASVALMSFDSESGVCGDVLWKTARYLMEPYCSVHYVGLPPL